MHTRSPTRADPCRRWWPSATQQRTRCGPRFGVCPVNPQRRPMGDTARQIIEDHVYTGACLDALCPPGERRVIDRTTNPDGTLHGVARATYGDGGPITHLGVPLFRLVDPS